MQIKTADGTASVSSLGMGGTALGIGIGALALSALNGNGNGILGGLFGNNNQYATKAELLYSQEVARKDAEIALLKSEQNTEVKIADVYERLITRINADARNQAEWNTQQAVNNAHMSAAIAANANSIRDLEHVRDRITKIIVPKDAICPEYMNRYNSWVAPVVTTEPVTQA